MIKASLGAKVAIVLLLTIVPAVPARRMYGVWWGEHALLLQALFALWVAFASLADPAIGLLLAMLAVSASLHVSRDPVRRLADGPLPNARV